MGDHEYIQLEGQQWDVDGDSPQVFYLNIDELLPEGRIRELLANKQGFLQELLQRREFQQSRGVHVTPKQNNSVVTFRPGGKNAATIASWHNELGHVGGKEQEMPGHIDLDAQIDAHALVMAELIQRREKRKKFEVLLEIDDKAVVYWEVIFPSTPGVTYSFAAVKAGGFWHVTGRKDASYLETEGLIRLLDKATEIVLLQPFVRTLFTSTKQIEGEAKTDEPGENTPEIADKA